MRFTKNHHAKREGWADDGAKQKIFIQDRWFYNADFTYPVQEKGYKLKHFTEKKPEMSLPATYTQLINNSVQQSQRL